MKNQIILIIPQFIRKRRTESPSSQEPNGNALKQGKKERPDGAKAITCYAFTPSERRNKHNLRVPQKSPAEFAILL